MPASMVGPIALLSLQNALYTVVRSHTQPYILFLLLMVLTLNTECIILYWSL